MNSIEAVEKKQMKSDLPPFAPGDTVKVHYKVVEGEKERIQVFEGIIIGIRGAGLSKTFKVRKVSYSIGVERTFPVHSPRIEKIVVARRGSVRRAKLYYLRDRVGKGVKVKEKRT